MPKSTERVKKPLRNAKVHRSFDTAAVMKLVDIGVSKSPAGNGVRVRVPPAAPIEEERAETLSYIVGVALGDGNLSCPNGRAVRLRITCDASYPVQAESISRALEILFPNNKVSRVERKDTYFDISVYSNKLIEWVPWIAGQGSKKAQRARVPGWIRKNQQFFIPCLRGLIQTDGCIYTDRGYRMINFTNNTKELAIDVYEMFLLLGFTPTFSKTKNGEFIKYTVRLARTAEVATILDELNFSKT